MPIKRLQRGAQFPCIGKLRKGAPRPESGKAPGKDLSYFRFDTKDKRAATMFDAVYGSEPAEIDVFLPHPTTDQNFPTWMECYTAGALQQRCDGETCVIWLKSNGKYSQEPKDCLGENCGCKEVGRLMVILPCLQRFAYVTVETHSINDIIRLTEQLQAVESLRGSLQGVPFVLRRIPVEISTPSGSNGKRARREKWLLSIEVSPEWAAMQLSTMEKKALSADSHVALLEDFGGDDVIIDSLDSVPEVPQDGPAHDPRQAAWDDMEPAKPPKKKPSAMFIEFQGAVKALFPKDADDARHWLVRGYTQRHTDSPRSSSKELSDDELSAITKELNVDPDKYQNAYSAYVEKRTKSANVTIPKDKEKAA